MSAIVSFADPFEVSDINRSYLIQLGWSRKRRKKWLRRHGITLHPNRAGGLRAFLDEADKADVCWCGCKNPYHAPIERGCGGTGIINCLCGGDFCVCHNHGEVECFGCEDCEGNFDDPDEGFDGGPGSDY